MDDLTLLGDRQIVEIEKILRSGSFNPPNVDAAGGTAAVAFTLAVVFVFLLLAAQYESVLLPLAVILIVPMCLFAAIGGMLLRGMDNNILTQIGFVVLIGLAAKNAILIVEFARQAEEQGSNRTEAAVQAASTRLLPILMTSFAFVLGVVPLALATGAGAEMRQSLGTAVFFGMLGVTCLGCCSRPYFMSWCVRSQVGGNRANPRSHPRGPDGISGRIDASTSRRSSGVASSTVRATLDRFRASDMS